MTKTDKENMPVVEMVFLNDEERFQVLEREVLYHQELLAKMDERLKEFQQELAALKEKEEDRSAKEYLQFDFVQELIQVANGGKK